MLTASDDLDPARIESLKGSAERIVSLYKFDPEQFHVYFHLLTISRLAETHFRVKGLANRLEEISLRFTINPKHPEGHTYLIPVRLEEVEVPQSLAREQRADLYESGGYLKLIKTLEAEKERKGRSNA